MCEAFYLALVEATRRRFVLDHDVHWLNLRGCVVLATAIVIPGRIKPIRKQTVSDNGSGDDDDDDDDDSKIMCTSRDPSPLSGHGDLGAT